MTSATAADARRRLVAALDEPARHRLLRTALALAVTSWVVALALLLGGAASPPAPEPPTPHAVVAAAEHAAAAWAEDGGSWTSLASVVAVRAAGNGHEVELLLRLHAMDGGGPERVRVVVGVADGPDGPVAGEPRALDAGG